MSKPGSAELTAISDRWRAMGGVIYEAGQCVRAGYSSATLRDAAALLVTMAREIEKAAEDLRAELEKEQPK